MTFMTYLFNRFFIETRDTDSARPSFSVQEFQLKNRKIFFLSARPDVSDFLYVRISTVLYICLFLLLSCWESTRLMTSFCLSWLGCNGRNKSNE